MSIEALSKRTKRGAPELSLPSRRASDATSGEAVHYLDKTQLFNSCGATRKAFEKRITDVNIAAQMLVDSYEDRVDMAFIISGNRDLTTPIQQVRKRFPIKRLIVVFSLNGHSAQLKKQLMASSPLEKPSCVKTSHPIL